MPVITDQMKTELIADALVGREHEVHSYQMNIDNYTLMLADLPQGEWPAELVQYKGTEPSKIAASVNEADMATIANYRLRDRLSNLLRTEHVEMNTAQRTLDALDGQLPAATKGANITAAVARRNAELAKAV